ncbi:cell filamentation protein Fic [Paramesorhizobium deserti]|uniref:Cell filamentation protein Fic n=1 Tax=Paramesorhizobium deserti TaxID=1494590 RepID=A0A135HY61_9HYPH|nr:Fic family protein [Paramesorhizobium deserti]KXF78137.1 cell filamentation protein Fic [Paramesorhizobium deserti]
MIWNWQQANWPELTYDAAKIEPLEKQFLLRSGEFIGAYRHIRPDEQDMLRIDLISDEALKTSEIEGEMLNRDSLQSSLRNQFGLGSDNQRIPPKERGISEMMVDLYRGFADPLTHESLFAWHRMVMAGERRIETIGAYRTHSGPMQVVSGGIGQLKIHFEAPLSREVPAEMDRYVAWFNKSAPDGEAPLSPLIRSGMAHIFFESIHPFEDGNGRIGRALSEKALAQGLGQPSLISLAYTIERNRKRYYDMLEASNKDTEITDWLVYFAQTVLEAQQTTMRRVDFYIAKARLYERVGNHFNERQAKAIARMFREGINGFKGGLSAENYISITKASRATATRDLHELVEIGVLTRSGERRYTRYHLNIETNKGEA